VLLASSSTIERIYSEVARLTAVVRVEAPRDIRRLFQPELSGCWTRSIARSRGSNIHQRRNPAWKRVAAGGNAAANAAAFTALDTRVQDCRCSIAAKRAGGGQQCRCFRADAENYARLLELSPDDTPDPPETAKRESTWSKIFPADPRRAHGMKVAIAISIALHHRTHDSARDMTVILWTIVNRRCPPTAPPTARCGCG